MDNTKPWYQSLTIWGAIVAALGPVAYQVCLAIKQPDLGTAIMQFCSELGAALAGYGRLTATSNIGKS